MTTKRMTLTIAALALALALPLLLSACSSNAPQALQEAAYIDAQFGKAAQRSFDMQVAHPETPYAEMPPEGMDGIHAENVMEVHNETYAEEPTEANVLQLGVTGTNSSR